MVSLHDVPGLWRRTLIAWPDGRSDTETQVFWLQGPRHYADLRIPARRPACSDVTCLRDLDWTLLRFMARQEGFFGRLDMAESIGQWHRAFDYQPDTGVADRGMLAFEDGILVERGIELPYTEHWLRQPDTSEAVALLLETEAGTPGCFVVAGDAFVYARGRTAALPHGVTLDHLIDDAASLQAAQDLFDCEISFGHRQSDDKGGDWRIERSSLCFREGAALAPVLDSAAGVLVVDDVTPEGAPIKRSWRVIGTESSNDLPPSYWLGSGTADEPQEPAAVAAASKFSDLPRN